jgi:hypothetical protein
MSYPAAFGHLCFDVSDIVRLLRDGQPKAAQAIAENAVSLAAEYGMEYQERLVEKGWAPS